MVAVENDNADDDSVESDGDRTKKTSLREVVHDVDGYFRIEEGAEKAHDCEEGEEHDVENLVIVMSYPFWMNAGFLNLTQKQ